MRVKLAIDGGAPAVTSQPPIKWPVYDDDDIRRVTEQLRSGKVYFWDESGPAAELEACLRRLLGVERVLTFSNGTAALRAAYFGLGLKPYDEVVTPSYTYAGTVTPLVTLGVVPVYADIDPDSWTVTRQTLEREITSRTRAVVVNHVFGNPAPIQEIQQLCSERGLFLVEDASHVFGQSINGTALGTFGDVGIFSLQAFKDVPAGEGGVLVCHRDDIFERAAVIMPRVIPGSRFEGLQYAGIGEKNRMGTLEAVLAMSKLPSLHHRVTARRQAMTQVASALEDLPAFSGQRCYIPGSHSYFAFRVKIKEQTRIAPASVVTMLRAEGVVASVPDSDSGPIHKLTLFAGGPETAAVGGYFAASGYRKALMRHSAMQLPVTEQLASRQISIRPLLDPTSRVVAEYCEAFRRCQYWLDRHRY